MGLTPDSTTLAGFSAPIKQASSAQMNRTFNGTSLPAELKVSKKEISNLEKWLDKKEMDISVRYPSTPGGPREGNTLATVIEEQEIYSSCLKQAV